MIITIYYQCSKCFKFYHKSFKTEYTYENIEASKHLLPIGNCTYCGNMDTNRIMDWFEVF